MDRGAWRAAVHRVAQSRTQLKWLSSGSSKVGMGPERPPQGEREGSASRGWASLVRWGLFGGRSTCTRMAGFSNS